MRATLGIALRLLHFTSDPIPVLSLLAERQDLAISASCARWRARWGGGGAGMSDRIVDFGLSEVLARDPRIIREDDTDFEAEISDNPKCENRVRGISTRMVPEPLWISHLCNLSEILGSAG